MPGTTHGAKRCGSVQHYGYAFRVFVVKNHRVSCGTARTVVRRGVNARGWDLLRLDQGRQRPLERRLDPPRPPRGGRGDHQRLRPSE